MPTFDVLSYGTIGLDYITRVPHFPSPDYGTHASSESEHLGGKASNVATILASWGLKVALSGNTLGDDDVGRRVLELLGRYPTLSTQYIGRQTGESSMFCRILVTPDGERAIIGFNVGATPMSQPTPAMIQDARLLTLDLYGGDERVEAAQLAHTAGVPVVVGDLRAPDHPVSPYAAISIASAAEVRTTFPALSLDDFARATQEAGTRQVIITDGPAEVRVYDSDGSMTDLMPPNVPQVDATGAGDAFRAGVVWGALRGLSLVGCAALGTACGSLTVGRPGAATDPPTRDEVSVLAQRVDRRLIRPAR